MYDISVNYWAVLVSGIAFMAIGYIWYGPLFGNMWLKAMDKKKEDMNPSMTPMIWSYVAAAVTSYILAHFIVLAGAATMGEALVTAFWLWLGFVVTATVTNSLYEGVKSTRVWLFVGYELVSLLVAAAILFAWK